MLENKVIADTSASRRNLRRRTFLPHSMIQLSGIDGTNRPAVESFVASQFFKNHQADVSDFLPYLMSAETEKKITSAIGFRIAARQPLFLEQYLEQPVETLISQLRHKPVSRHKIAEIGNLASSAPGSSQMLFVLVISVLHRAGIDWAIFTATRPVQRMIASLGINCLEICRADETQLKQSKDSWGDYYTHQPKVIAGHLETAYNRLCEHSVAGFMIQNYQETIDACVLQLSREH